MTTRARSPPPSWPAPTPLVRRCCTPDGGGCASIRRRCARPASASTSTRDSTASSTPSPSCTSPPPASSTCRSSRPHRRGASSSFAGLPDDRLVEARESERFAGALRPYQRRGLAWLRFLERLRLGGCLADDMGLGKTATTLAHLQCRPGPHLVVCPLSVVHNWFAEAARFTPDLHVVVHHGADRDLGLDRLVPADVVVTTYGLLPRDLGQLGAVEWSTLVLDEAQQIKNPATRAARAVRALRAGQKIALTGTPVENRLAELWAILDAVNPGLLGSREQFRHRYARPIEREGDAAAATRLRRITQPFVLRRSKSDRQLVPDLPDKIEQIAWAGLSTRAGRALPARRRSAAGRRRAGDRHAPPRPRAGRAHPAQADLQPPGSRARRRIPPARAVGKAGPLRRARRRAARRRRAGVGVHAVPRDGRAAAAPRRRAVGAAGAVPPRRRLTDPSRRDGR